MPTPPSRIRRFVRALGALLRPHAGPLATAVAIASVYFLLDLRGGDLAAHLYRAELFKNDGFFVWNYNWYGGHYVVSYGVLFPTLASTIGVRLAGALAYLVATLLFSILARRIWEARGARAAGYVFAVTFSASLVIGQLPFALGIAIGLGALLAAATAHPWLAALLAINCAATSPLAALFVAFIAVVVWTANRALAFAVVAAACVLPAMTLSILFPEGGSQPFHIASYLGSLAFTAFFWAMVRDHLAPDTRRTVDIGTALYVSFLTANELIASPIGGNAIRLGMLVFPTFAAAVLWPRSGRYALAVILPLFCWQASPALWSILTHDDTRHPRYFEPVNAYLDTQDPERDEKVEVVFTRNHFEAAYVANRRPIARGWERQLDTKYNAIFYEEGLLNSRTYAEWLAENDVRWVALPDATHDYSGRAEAELIRAGLSYLELAHRTSEWTIYRVTLPESGGVDGQFFRDPEDGDGYRVQPASFGRTVTRIRWQRFLRPSAGCIRATEDGFLEIELPEPLVSARVPGGPGAKAAVPRHAVSSRPPMVTITADFSISRLVSGAPVCADGYEQDDSGRVRRSTRVSGPTPASAREAGAA